MSGTDLPAESLSYRLDDRDRVVAVGGAWDSFALENDNPALVSSRVLGRRLWDLIIDPDVRRVYEPLFRRVRERALEISFPFRCDAPHERRFLRMRLAIAEHGELVVESLLERKEHRQKQCYRKLAALSIAQSVVLCSRCNAVDTPDGWVEIERAVSGVMEATDQSPRVMFAWCPDCRAQLSQAALSMRTD